MRWVALAVMLALWLVTWPQILPPEADLPPCHMMLLIALAGAWTLFEFRRDRRRRQKAGQHGCCPKCGCDLTGKMSGRCPECGQKGASGTSIL